MKYSCLILLVSFSHAGVQAQQSLRSFERVIVTGSVYLTLKKGAENAYTASGDTVGLKVDVQGSRLQISRTNILSDSGKGRANVTVWYRDIRSISASAGARVGHDGTLNAGDFDLNVDTGASGDITIDASSVNVRVGEGGVLRIEGVARALEVSATTGSVLKARDFIAHTVYVRSNTGASATVHATEEIDATASLGGSVTYTGNPKTVRIRENLGGSVRG